MDEFTWGIKLGLGLFMVLLIVVIVLFRPQEKPTERRFLYDTHVPFRKDDLADRISEKLTLLVIDTAGMTASLASIDESLKKIASSDSEVG